MLGNPCCATFSLFCINFLFHCNKLPHRSGLKRNHLIVSQFCGSDVGRGAPRVQTEVKYGHVSLQRLRKESVPLLPAARGDHRVPCLGTFLRLQSQRPRAQLSSCRRVRDSRLSLLFLWTSVITRGPPGSGR